jgi:hypothetical protein
VTIPADKLGLINWNIGFGPGQRPPLRLDRAEEPLEAECDRGNGGNTTSYILPYNKGEIICPVPGAVVVAAPQKPKRVLETWLPEESPAGDAAIGIFFAQNCPGYITPASRELIQAFMQLRAREAWDPYHKIQAKIGEAASANRTSADKELFEWCIAAEPRINSIQDKIGRGVQVSDPAVRRRLLL